MSKDTKESSAPEAKLTYRIPAGSNWSKAWMVSGALGLVGAAASAFGMMNDPGRFAFSWLFAFLTVLALGLGALFFTIGQHLTGAGWGVTVRRTSEFLLSGLPIFVVLFIPIAMNLEHLYPWVAHNAAHHEGAEHGEHHDGAEHEGAEHEGAEHEEAAHGEEHGALDIFGSSAVAQDIAEPQEFHPGVVEIPHSREANEHHIHSGLLDVKEPYLNRSFFMIRAGIYFLVWILLSFMYVGWSTRQDKEKGVKLTQKMQKAAPVSTFLFGFTLTFASIDWMMSLEPGWYSTIFGVQYYSVSVVCALAVIILLSMAVRKAGFIGNAVSVEHFHDLGKLLHGFVVFWAYISFSQFMLIWYAGIPEEATYFHLRWWGGGGFGLVGMIVLFGKFFIPFFMLLSRNTKRNLNVLAFGAAWIVVMHVIEVYWLVMPYAAQTGLVSTSLNVHWMDIASLLAVGGIYMSVVLWQMTRYPLVPVGDPRFERSVHFENV